MMTRRFDNIANTSYYNTNYQYSNVPTKENDGDKMHGSRRVIVFCFLTTILPTMLIVLPLYLRNIKYADVMYRISDSDVIQIHKGQSSVFCERHSLRMNTSFNAFQMKGVPELSEQRKHIRLKKSMTLPDDTLEYWGFYLLKGASVELKACSRHEGSKILVVKGQKILDTCGILDSYKYRKEKHFDNKGSVLVTLEDPKVTTKKPYIEEENTINEDDQIDNDIEPHRHRYIRSTKLHNPNTVLDTGVHHGGNADDIEAAKDSAVSSFENNLYECYHDNMLMNEFFPYSINCNSTNYLEETTTLKVIHEVLDDGYYYYIFYSDNDFVVNDIHAIFDIYKPTFQYVNDSNSKTCVNKTECEFDVGFLSDELVIVEVPTKEGLQNSKNDVSILVSVCHPRVSIYIIFPVLVLLLVLVFAFL